MCLSSHSWQAVELGESKGNIHFYRRSDQDENRARDRDKIPVLQGANLEPKLPKWRAWSNQAEGHRKAYRATWKENEVQGKKSRRDCGFFFLCFVLFLTFPSHSIAIKKSLLTNQENLKGLQIYTDKRIHWRAARCLYSSDFVSESYFSASLPTLAPAWGSLVSGCRAKSSSKATQVATLCDVFFFTQFD